ncbi:HD-GYP domain-containing protein [Alicyclobacillaceae bacterium I2511]|nr:HD-GYP domain-containing protein [Alicyclobacillaceae bacterium I2511]
MCGVRWVAIRNVRANSVLAQPILDERGRILLARGVLLSDNLLVKLRTLGIGSVCVEDALTDDIVGKDFISPHVRQQMLDATYSSLNDLASGTHVRYVRGARLRQKLRPLVEEVIEELRNLGGAEQFGTVYLSDGELYHHSVNVALFALSVGLGMKLSADQLLDLGIGALLHDVGKMRIPEKVLKKPGRLTDAEYTEMKLHAQYGYEILLNDHDLHGSARLISYEHHERMDGTGYPRGLVGGDIHLFGRITAVVDVYEALTANRVYRPAYLPHEAYELILGGGGTQFDATVVDGFVDAISIYPVGMTVELSSGYRGVVIHSPRRQTQRPLVRVIEDDNGQPVSQPFELDLSRELTVQIIGCEI